MFEKVSTDLNFVARENEVSKFWEENHIFEKSEEIREGCPVYSFYDGPPTANGKPHIGHVLTRAIKDMIPRYHTMKGEKSIRKAGWDTHGLPVEIEVEKEIGISGKDQIEAYGLEPFIDKCKESVWRYKGMWEDFSAKVGYWADMDDPYITYDNNYIESEWWSLKRVWDRGLLYKGHKVVPYCPRCGTPLSSHEVAQGYKDVKDTPKDENGNLVWKYDEDDMIQKYIDARKIEWVLDENNPLRFTRGGLIKEGYELKERPSIQEITDETLINALNSNLRTYADLSNKMKKYGKCVFEGMIDSNKNHESFKRKNNLPYLEQHHFILQEIYKNYKNNNNEKELKKIIYSTDNILLLCPRCHRMIHQANEETVKQMIDLLKNSNHYYTLFKNVERVEKMINKKNLINEMYNINK